MAEERLDSRTAGGQVMTLALFTVTIFFSASLLFFVQPLYAKIVLPKIGGAPAVWTTAMLFFQTVLIVGYLYAHIVTRRLSTRVQIGLHATLWVMALYFLPLSAPEGWELDVSGSISVQTLVLFAGGVGLPFAMLSANAPLIQHWYSRTGGPSANDPYFLYGASNFGSMIALLGFPLIAEPFFTAGQIGWAFAVGFVVLGTLLVWCGLTARTGSMASPTSYLLSSGQPRMTDFVVWGVLAFIPSSLMLASTTKISTDFGALPLVWVVPLALYLLTFVIAFSRKQLVSARFLTLSGATGIIISGLAFSGVLAGTFSIKELLLVVCGFFLVSLWAHGRMYDLRPGSDQLTGFYIAISVGGACGGLFNAILAPVIFNKIWEGHITLGIAAIAFVVPFTTISTKLLFRSLLVGATVGLCALTAQIILGIERQAFLLLSLAAAVTAAISFRKNVVAASFVLLLAFLIPIPFLSSNTLFEGRSFFGVHRVVDFKDFRRYLNGTTLHGMQALEELTAERPTPISYYHPLGGLGSVLSSREVGELKSIGVIGLGTGALTCYAAEGQYWTLYEIDPVVEFIARDSGLFTYLSNCAEDTMTRLGDARVVLNSQPEVTFDLLVVDAYSSDAIPVHLTTLEAIQLYQERLNPGGVVLFHISNRYYDLSLQLARAAKQIDMSAWRYQQPKVDMETTTGFERQDVVAFTSDGTTITEIVSNEDWKRLVSDEGRVWTDDHANVLSSLKILK